MSQIWEQFINDEKTGGASDLDIENEKEKREINPDLYDAALAIWEYNDPELLKTLINKKDFNVNEQTPRSHQPLLFLATVKNRVDSFQLLLDSGADCSCASMDKNLLFWAVHNNCRIDIISTLIEKCSMEATNDILFTAISRCDEVSVLYLLTHGNADILHEAGDNDFTFNVSLFEEALNNRLYSVAKKILEQPCPVTLEHLKDADYAAELEEKMSGKQKELRSLLSSINTAEREIPNYSKIDLIEITEMLKAKLGTSE